MGVVEDREAATAAFDALDTALEAVIGLDVETLCTASGSHCWSAAKRCDDASPPPSIP